MTLPRLKRKKRLTADLARTISVDRANSRVGINSVNPKTKLSTLIFLLQKASLKKLN